MLKRILVPLDGSSLAEGALTYASALAEKTAAEILLLRATHSHTLHGVDPRERQQGAIDEAQEYLDAIMGRLSTRRLSCASVVRSGSPAECIIESARTRRADLIVMASHGRTGPGRWIFGSVSEAVVAGSQVPVLVQRSWQPLFGQTLLDDNPKIIVPLDRSAFAESAVWTAAALAIDLSGKLALLSVQDRPPEIHATDEYLASVQAHIATVYPYLPTTREIRNRNVAQGIEEAVAQLQAALVVMATHGRTGPQRAVLGSVAGRLLQESDVPVVLVRPSWAEVEETTTVATRAAGRAG